MEKDGGPGVKKTCRVGLGGVLLAGKEALQRPCIRCIVTLFPVGVQASFNAPMWTTSQKPIQGRVRPPKKNWPKNMYLDQ